jgi:methylated-DNA-protein-cysteine methyltransferase-like protein
MHKINNDFEQVYQMVRQIPDGKVATYGQVALWLGWPHGARTVGWALRALSEGSGVPWHRILNAQGRISQADAELQQELLEAEGIVFRPDWSVDLKQYQWTGPHLSTDLA